MFEKRNMIRAGLLKLVLVVLTSVIAIYAFSSCDTTNSDDLPPEVRARLKEIEYFIIIYQENRSFDFMFGDFPGANGIPDQVPPQLQFSNNPTDPYSDGLPYETLPQPKTQELFLFGDNILDPRFPDDLPNEPFLMDPFVDSFSPNIFLSSTGDPVHRFYQCIGQINEGEMDKFVAWASTDWPGEPAVDALIMGYTDQQNSPLLGLAKEYVLNDNFFQSMYGGSAPNHWVLISGQPLRWVEGLNDPRMQVTGGVIKLNAQNLPADKDDDGWLTPNGWVVNNPQDSGPEWDYKDFLPPPDLQTNPTIGDRLLDAGVSWKWYAQYLDAIPGINGSDDINEELKDISAMEVELFRDGAAQVGDDKAVAAYNFVLDTPGAFDLVIGATINGWYTVNPFTYFKNFKVGSQNAKNHLTDITNFKKDLENGTLPQVSFIKHLFPDDEHPADSDLLQGQMAVADIVEQVKNSDIWDKSAIIITYDENGGFWDHVAPPNGKGFDNTVEGFKFGPGPRVPCVVVSPFGKKGYVDSNPYQTTSITRMLEIRYGLEPVNKVTRDSPPLVGWLDVAP